MLTPILFSFQGSVYVTHGKATEVIIKKKEEGPHWPRLTKDKIKLHWLSVDWARDIDEDEEDATKKFDLGNYDPSQMGDFMSGYGGSGGDDDMGGMGGGMGGMDPEMLQKMMANIQEGKE